MIVRSVGMVGVCMMCVCDRDESERWVGPGVNDGMLSETLQVTSLAESAARAFQLPKKP